MKNYPYVIFCSGMTRSASCWSYHTCKYIVGLRVPPEYITNGYLGEDDTYVDTCLSIALKASQSAGNEKCVTMFMSHDFGKRSVQMILNGLAKNVYTYRDPRDAIASGMRIDGKGYEVSFSKVEACLRRFDLFAMDSHSLLLQFSDILNKPLAITSTIANYLGFDLTHEEIYAVHQRTEQEAIERRNQQRRDNAHSKSDIETIDNGLGILKCEPNSAPKVDNPWRYSSLNENQYADATKRLKRWLIKMNFSTSPVPTWKQD